MQRIRRLVFGFQPDRCATVFTSGQRCNSPLSKDRYVEIEGERYCLHCYRLFLDAGVIVEQVDPERGTVERRVVR